MRCLVVLFSVSKAALKIKNRSSRSHFCYEHFWIAHFLDSEMAKNEENPEKVKSDGDPKMLITKMGSR